MAANDNPRPPDATGATAGAGKDAVSPERLRELAMWLDDGVLSRGECDETAAALRLLADVLGPVREALEAAMDEMEMVDDPDGLLDTMEQHIGRALDLLPKVEASND